MIGIYFDAYGLDFKALRIAMLDYWLIVLTYDLEGWLKKYKEWLLLV